MERGCPPEPETPDLGPGKQLERLDLGPGFIGADFYFFHLMSSSQIFISRLLRGMARGVPWFCILTCFALAVTGGGGTGMHRGSHPHSLVLPLRGLRGGGGGCKDASETDARRFIDSYTPSVYAKMRDDSIRTSAYKRALNALAPNRTVLDIGTGGLAILAISAAQAGAKRVYAIEASKGAYEQA